MANATSAHKATALRTPELHRANDINPYISEADKAHILEILRASNNQGIFTPGTDKRNSIQIPADDGGANWGNGAADPKQA